MNNQNKKSSKKPNKDLKQEKKSLENEFKDLLQRTQADFVNYKKRIEFN